MLDIIRPCAYGTRMGTIATLTKALAVLFTLREQVVENEKGLCWWQWASISVSSKYV